MKTILIILNPIDNTKFIELPDEMSNYPFNIGDLIIREATMRIKAIDINLNHKERYIYVSFEFGAHTEKDFVEKSGSAYYPDRSSIGSWFNYKSKGKVG